MKRFTISDFHRIDGNLNIFCNYNQSLFGYSDGQEIEERIYSIIRDARDLSCLSVELRSKIFNWASEYHLSPIRHNLLRHVGFQEGDSILELGCGCGAITRQLGESGASVTAIEGSLSRIKCAASRCRDLPNVRFYCSNIWDIELLEKYDYITLIGVLEYVPLFIDSSNPVEDFLAFIKSSLKETGTLIIAIENQLGLKYFCGHEEDHVGIPFFGIEGRYNEKTAVTFGKNNLLDILKDSGFKNVRFEYPFPDYKCPQFIFTELAFNTSQFLPEPIIQQLESRSYSGRELKPIFEEILVWDVLSKNFTTTLFSNSFLIFASASKENDTKEDKSILAVGYSLNRSNQYKTKTEFYINDNDNIFVRKSRLLENSTKKVLDTGSEIIEHNISLQNYHFGENLETRLLKSITKNNFESFVSDLKIWIEFMITNGIAKRNEEDTYSSIMNADFIDCIPSNLIIQSAGKIVFFDREWTFNEPFSLRDVILRYLYDSNKESKYYNLVNRSLAGKIRPMLKLIKYLGVDISEEQFQNFLFISDSFYSSNQESYVNQYGTVTLEKSSLNWELTNKELQQAQIELNGFKTSIFFKMWSIWVKIRKKMKIPKELRFSK